MCLTVMSITDLCAHVSSKEKWRSCFGGDLADFRAILLRRARVAAIIYSKGRKVMRHPAEEMCAGEATERQQGTSFRLEASAFVGKIWEGAK